MDLLCFLCSLVSVFILSSICISLSPCLCLSQSLHKACLAALLKVAAHFTNYENVVAPPEAVGLAQDFDGESMGLEGGDHQQSLRARRDVGEVSTVAYVETGRWPLRTWTVLKSQFLPATRYKIKQGAREDWGAKT